jgi:hypothetical protein
LPLVEYGCNSLDSLGLSPEDTPDVGILRARFPGIRVWVLQAEATLRNQGADYAYEGGEEI